MVTPRRLAIVGGGAKAAAIAAKADILFKKTDVKVEITVFEKHTVGSNWSGAGGYTDGEARLCTLAERDLGFPYGPSYKPEVPQSMYRNYSWDSYLVAVGGARGFADWVNQGRKPPTHAEYAGYLQWALSRAGVTPTIGAVYRAEPTPKGWNLHSRNASGRRSDGPFHGLVFTGPGPALKKVARRGVSSKITDGRRFWLDTARFLGRRRKSEEPVVIVGAGGTSAAVAARVLRDPRVDKVVIIGDQAVLFTRTETFFENQVFTNDELWENLSPKTRTEFTDRLNRGVVWSTISDELAKSAGKLYFEPGRGRCIEVRRGVAGEELVVHYERNGKMFEVEASLVVDASGFDPWWFLSVLPRRFRAPLSDPDADRQRELRLQAMSGMDRNLVLFRDPAGPVHAPMVSQVVGPGFASLMVLGSMSDRILDAYA